MEDKMNTLDMYKIAENEKIDILNYSWTNIKLGYLKLVITIILP